MSSSWGLCRAATIAPPKASTPPGRRWDSLYPGSPAYFTATEWSGGSVIDLGGLPGSTQSSAYSINDAGQVVGLSRIGDYEHATEWSGGSIIDLLPGSTSSDSVAESINDAGQVVGGGCTSSGCGAIEWSGGSVINLGGLPGSLGNTATGINDAGQVVGYSFVGGLLTREATAPLRGLGLSAAAPR
jgi:probable HAF family extracellular repeat protein